MAPSGRVSVHLSSSDLASAQRVDLEVLGSGGSASAAISGEARPVSAARTRSVSVCKLAAGVGRGQRLEEYAGVVCHSQATEYRQLSNASIQLADTPSAELHQTLEAVIALLTSTGQAQSDSL